MSSLHQAHLVVYDINKNFEKKIINLTPYLKKIKNFEDIKEFGVSLREIDGYDYLLISIAHHGDGRQLTFEAFGPRSQEIQEAILNG